MSGIRQVKKNGRILLRVVENTKVAGKVKQKFICGLENFYEDEVEEIQRYTGIGERLIVDFKNQRSPALPGMEDIIHGRKKTQKSDNSSPSSYKNLKEEARIRVGINDAFADEFGQWVFWIQLTANTGKVKTINC